MVVVVGVSLRFGGSGVVVFCVATLQPLSTETSASAQTERHEAPHDSTSSSSSSLMRSAGASGSETTNRAPPPLASSTATVPFKSFTCSATRASQGPSRCRGLVCRRSPTACEAIEDPVLIFRGNPGSGVFHRDVHRLLVARHLHA